MPKLFKNGQHGGSNAISPQVALCSACLQFVYSSCAGQVASVCLCGTDWHPTQGVPFPVPFAAWEMLQSPLGEWFN